MVKDRTKQLIAALIGAIAVAVAASCVLGVTAIAPQEIARALIGLGDDETMLIVWEIRLPRALGALMVGSALGISGAALQGLLRNPLAEPGVLGVSATASLCATIAIYWGLIGLSPWVLPIASIGGALVATALLALIARRVGSVVTLILVGVGLSSLAGSVMSLLLNFAPNPFTLSDMVTWMMGSVANRSFMDLAFAAPFFGLGLVMLLMSGAGLRALALGEESARALGLNVSRARLLVVMGAGLMTGAAVCVAGAVGFVGIIAPHLVRPLVGYDPARTLIPSALTGGLVLVLADIMVRLAPTTQELKLGVIVGLIGAPFFIYIAARRRTFGENQ